MKHLIIFDFDGVICDSLSRVLALTAEIAEELGGSSVVTAEAIAHLDNVTFAEIGNLAGLRPSMHEQFELRIFKAFSQDSRPMPAFAGVAEMLARLSERAKLAVVTANHPDVVRTVLSSIAAAEFISRSVGGDTPGSKSEKIQWLLADCGIAAEDCWMIGDSRSDIREGKKARVNTLGVTWGWQPAEVLAALEPTAIVDTPEALADFLSTRVG